MILIEDVANKDTKHFLKNKYWELNGIEVLRYGLPAGDYIICDDKISEIIERKRKRGLEPKKMDFLGSYSVSVDTKKDMAEIESNLISSHERFRDECILAQNNGIKLYVLIENKDGIKTIDDVFKYTSTRRLRWLEIDKAHQNGKMLQVKIPPKPPVTGAQLAKIMLAMQEKYGVEFVFCRPEESGAKVIELLTRE